MGGDREGDRPLGRKDRPQRDPRLARPDKVEVGWELHPEFWGRGLATEGGRAGVRHGFEVVGLARILSATMATNAASRRVMDKCGLRFQGELHLPETVVAWYAIDRADWRASQAATGP
jgi:RimJ/RimL family protein N-acetyltransferase